MELSRVGSREPRERDAERRWKGEKGRREGCVKEGGGERKGKGTPIKVYVLGLSPLLKQLLSTSLGLT